MSYLLLRADARQLPLADESVHCCVTSPPYWGLRDYGVAGQIGLESTLEEYIAQMVAVFREVWRVLRPDGTLWLNLGDKYCSTPNGPALGSSTLQGGLAPHAEYRVAHAHRSNGIPVGLKHKDLLGLPWRVAFALQADGWILRRDIIWAKPNPMPESVQDRPTTAHEYLFLLSKQPRYYYDQEAVRKPFVPRSVERAAQNIEAQAGSRRVVAKFNGPMKAVGDPTKGANLKSVWHLAPRQFAEAHFATFPEGLVEPCILAATSAKGVCPACGAPWERQVEVSGGTTGKAWHDHKGDLKRGQNSGQSSKGYRETYVRKTTGWRPGCDCGRQPVPAVVLDPFVGSGTTCRVADRLGRRGVGLDLNSEYLEIAKRYCGKPLQRSLLEEAAA